MYYMMFLLLATLNKYLLLPPCGFEPLIFLLNIEYRIIKYM
jgi:hypothetical protein